MVVVALLARVCIAYGRMPSGGLHRVHSLAPSSYGRTSRIEMPGAPNRFAQLGCRPAGSRAPQPPGACDVVLEAQGISPRRCAGTASTLRRAPAAGTILELQIQNYNKRRGVKDWRRETGPFSGAQLAVAVLGLASPSGVFWSAPRACVPWPSSPFRSAPRGCLSWPSFPFRSAPRGRLPWCS